VVALQLLGWAGSALLVFSVLQTRILRLRIFGGVASAVLVIFNAAIAVWPMVAMNVVLTAINVFYIVRLLRTRHDPETFDVVEISPQEKYVRYLLNQFAADVQRFNPGFSADNAARADHGFLILRGAETVGLVLARDAGDATAHIELDYVVPRYQGFTLGEFVYRSDGPLATLGYHRAVAPQGMMNAGDYLTDVGFRHEGDDMVRDLV
jgi:hypothetical protein